MEIILLFLLILFNGFFAMAEIALVTAHRAKLTARAAEGSQAALAAIRLGEDPTRFLSAVQIGITSIGLFSGIVGESALAAPLSVWLEGLGMSASAASMVSTALVVVTITYLSIVIGELVPKRLGQLAPETTACVVARPMSILAFVSRPFVALLSGSTRLLLRLLGVNPDEQPTVTEEELQAMIDESSEAGTLEKKQQEMMRNIFRFDDRPVSSIMTPRADILYLDTELPPEKNLDILRKQEHPWLPICQGGFNQITGVIATTRAALLFTGALPTAEAFRASLAEQAKTPLFVPETLTALELLKIFQEQGHHVAFIVDEYGTLQGLVSPQALLDVLAGQTGAQHEESWAIAREDGSWLMDGSIPVPELKDRLGIKILPAEEKGYSILSGMLMALTGRIPREGEIMEWAGWIFEIVDMDGNMIDKVLVSKAPSTQNG